MSYEDRKSTWNSGARKAIRRGSAEEEVHKHRDRVTGAWKQISKQRRRVDVSYDLSMVTALHHGIWMDEEGFKKTCITEKKKTADVHQPFFYGTWVADFMLRQDAGRSMLGKLPAPMNHSKYLRACPAKMPFQNWYTTNTNYFRLSDFCQMEMNNTTGLSNKHHTA